MSSQPLAERRARLDALAAALSVRAPALQLEYRSGTQLLGDRGTAFEWVGLVARSSLTPEGLAQVVPFIHYENGTGVPMFQVAIYEGTPPAPVFFRHIADPDAVIQAIIDWATGPLRTGAGKQRSAAALEKRAQRDVAKAIQDALKPPVIREPAELAGADASLMAFHFPRDQLGRMRASARVLLEVLEVPARPGGRSRCRFLRMQDGTFAGNIADEFVENQDHRWHTQLWRWKSTPSTPTERWGIDDLDRARTTVQELETGNWDAAFRSHGVVLGTTLQKILNAQPLGHLYRDLAAGWATVTAEQLARSAPWRLAALATKKSVRLFGLGGINVQAKPGVNLQLVAGRPTLDLESSASNRRLAREDWERPLDFEAYRLSIEPPAGLSLDWPRAEARG